MNNIDAFIQRWGNQSMMAPIPTQDITTVETTLNILLPESFKYLISTYGLIRSPNALTKVCSLSSDVSQVQDFLSLDDMSSLSKLYELTGMPKGHILFASDCKGNMFCFKATECETQQVDLPVWYFDRDIGTVTKVSNTFIKWLDNFNKLS